MTSPFRLSRALSFVLVLLLGLVASCSDPVSPRDPGDGGYKRPVDSSFALVKLIGDSLYAGETAMLVARGPILDTAPLSLYIHTSKAAITSRRGDTLVFRVPSGQPGKIRLYAYDSILAVGDISMTIYPEDIREINPSIFDMIGSTGGFRGEFITLLGIQLARRARDIDARIGNVPLEIIKLSETEVRLRIPEEASTGTLNILMFDRLVIQIPEYVIYEHTGEFMPDRRFSTAVLNAAGLDGRMKFVLPNELDSLEESSFDGINLSRFLGQFQNAGVRVGDSLIFEGSEPAFPGVMRVNMRFKTHGDSNLVSGIVHLITIDNEGMSNESRVEIKLVLDRMRWVHANGATTLYAYGEEIGKQLTELVYIEDVPFTTNTIVERYDRSALATGRFTLVFSQ